MKVTTKPNTVEGKLKIRVRLICDRQDLIEEQKLRSQGLTPVMFDRLDMYWLDLFIGDTDLGSACIDPDLNDPEHFSIRRNWSEISDESWPEVKKVATKFFLKSPEYKQQIKWTQSLIDAGYKGFGGEPCKVCEHWFEVQGKHLHRTYEGKIYPYHKSDCLAGEQEILDEKGLPFKEKQHA